MKNKLISDPCLVDTSEQHVPWRSSVTQFSFGPVHAQEFRYSSGSESKGFKFSDWPASKQSQQTSKSACSGGSSSKSLLLFNPGVGAGVGPALEVMA